MHDDDLAEQQRQGKNCLSCTACKRRGADYDRTGGKTWLQTIYYPLMYASAYGRGVTMRPVIKCGTYSTAKHTDIPYLESAVIHNESKRELAVFAVNRSTEEEMEMHMVFEDFGDCIMTEHIELYSEDLKAKNTAEKEVVFPQKVQIGENNSEKTFVEYAAIFILGSF